MVKKHPPCNKQPKNETSVESEQNSTTLSVHERNLYIFSLPLLVSFNLIHSLIYFILIGVKHLWKCILKFRNLRQRCTEKTQTTEIEINKSYTEDRIRSTEIMSKNSNYRENLLMKQKVHHKKAFEFITKALQIDEEVEG